MDLPPSSRVLYLETEAAVTAQVELVKRVARRERGANLVVRDLARSFLRELSRALHRAAKASPSSRESPESAYEVQHGLEALRDVRAALLNAMTSLTLTRPHALVDYHGALQGAIADVKRTTYDALRFVRGSVHASVAPHVMIGPPYANDPARLNDSFNVHV